MGCLTLLYAPTLIYMAAGPHGGPTVVLAFLLSVVLASSWNLRQLPALPAWALTVAAGMIGLGALSTGSNLGSVPPLLGLAAFGATLFVWLGRRELKTAFPLGVLGVCVLLVAYFSGGRGSGRPMEAWYLHHGFSTGQAEFMTLAFRKTVHVTFYGTVGLTTLIAVRNAGAKRPEAARTALLAALTVAACDELRQSGYANRSGSPWDVLLDFSAAVVCVGLSEWLRARRR